MITKSIIGSLSDGRPVTSYKITNLSGEYAEILDYGAVINSLCVLDRNGKSGDCVLAAPDVKSMEGRSFKAATIGRVANRIEYGKFSINGVETKLEQNRGGHFIHGGSGNYAFKMFDAAIENDSTLLLSYHDNGEGGFGSPLEFRVHFTFNDSHSLIIHYEAETEHDTIVCPTNHAYFNLCDYGDIGENMLTLYSHNLAKSGENGIPTGGVVPVAGTGYDFTSERNIGEALKSLPEGVNGYDSFYVLDRSQKDNLAAELYSPKTGRVMRAYTDMQSVVLFTPSNCIGHSDKAGTLTEQYSAVCIETQFVPNAVNCPEFDSPILLAGQKFDSTTIYSFGVR